MIIENIQKSDIQTIGDIKQIKASIDVKNIEFITTLLSSNLYSQPLKSFLREIVSNAWDSHVAADNTKEPVIIKIAKDRISIRDYGTGLSDEEFEDLYCKIGSSDKRLSNKYIGCFGIGHMASLAVSNVVYITNYYNGISSNYVMVKENGTITTNLLGKQPTMEHNGLLVSVPNTFDNNDIAKECLSLVFFPNIYVDYSGITVMDSINVNKAKVARYKNFSVSNILKETGGRYDTVKRMWVLLGNVLYPLETSNLTMSSYVSSKLRYLCNCNVCLNIPIGSINVTPNRESIIYSESTIKILSDKLEEAVHEIDDITNKLCTPDTDSALKFYEYISDNHYWNPVTNDIEHFTSSNYPIEMRASYKGVIRSKVYKSTFKWGCRGLVPGFKCITNGSNFYTEKGAPYNLRDSMSCRAIQFLTVEDGRNISGYLRKMIADTPKWWNTPIIDKLPADEFIDDILRSAGEYKIDKLQINPDALEAAVELQSLVSARTYTIKVAEIEDYKKSFAVKRVRNVDNTLYTLHRIRDYWSCSYLEDTPANNVKIDEIIKTLKKMGKCILHCGRDFNDAQVKAYKILSCLDYNIIWCSTTLYNKLIKYIGNKKNPKEFSNVVLDYTSIFTNPSVSTELKIVLGRFCYTKFVDDEDIINAFNKVKPLLKNNKEFDTYINGLKYSSNRSKCMAISQCDTFKDYKVKSTEAKWLEKYIQDNFTTAKKYHNVIKNLEYEGLNNHRIASYITARWCIKHKKPINYSKYLTQKDDKLIKLIYE